MRVESTLWTHQHSQVVFDVPAGDPPSRSRVSLGTRAELELQGADGACLLRSVAGEAFGVCGPAWLFHFEVPSDAQYYGMGEKGVGFERSGLRTKFWNTDVWADFPMSQVRHGATDPMYANVPWVIIKQVNCYVGLLLNNPGAAFLRTPPARAQAADRRLWFGAPDGQPELFIIVGPSLPELTEKLQRLVGVTPRPPPGPSATNSAAGVTRARRSSMSSPINLNATPSPTTASGWTSTTCRAFASSP